MKKSGCREGKTVVGSAWTAVNKERKNGRRARDPPAGDEKGEWRVRAVCNAPQATAAVT